jgi:hypothetical protein
MKNLTLSALVIFTVLVGVRGAASAQILDPNEARCNNAFVDEATAMRRYAWAVYCTTHPGHFRTASGRLLEVEAYKYITNNNMILHDDDPDTRRNRLYPAYLQYLPDSSVVPWFIPDASIGTLTPTVCNTPEDTIPGFFPTNVSNAGLCVAGCYLESVALQFVDGTMGIKAASDARKMDLVTLSPDATLDNLQFTNNTVRRYVRDLVESVQEIYTLTMRSGGQLRVTSEHPLLTSDGVIRQAQQLQLGNELLLATGKPDAIVDISVEKLRTKVYNVEPVTTDYVSNIVIAGGYLNGSLRYQNEFLNTINALILRRSLAELGGN